MPDLLHSPSNSEAAGPRVDDPVAHPDIVAQRSLQDPVSCDHELGTAHIANRIRHFRVWHVEDLHVDVGKVRSHVVFAYVLLCRVLRIDCDRTAGNVLAAEVGIAALVEMGQSQARQNVFQMAEDVVVPLIPVSMYKSRERRQIVIMIYDECQVNESLATLVDLRLQIKTGFVMHGVDVRGPSEKASYQS